MRKEWSVVIYLLGVVSAVYLLFRYIIPFALKFLGVVLGAAFYLIMWVVIAFCVLLLVAYLVNMTRKR